MTHEDTHEPEVTEEVEADEAVEPAPAAEEPAPEPAEEPEPDQEPEPDYKDLYLRSAAEAENVRKRARRDVASAEIRGISKLATQLLPALDNLDRAIAHAEAEEGEDDHHLTHGIRLVQQELAAALERVGIKADVPLGQQFDPHRHEALAQNPVANTAPGIVVEVYQPGYTYEDTVLRAAKVVVSA